MGSKDGSDGFLVSGQQDSAVRKEAENVLERAGALGVYPTPIDEILDAHEILVADEDIFDDSFIQRFARKAGGALKKAKAKVLGLFDALENVVFLNRDVPAAKLPFLKLHEAGHALLPWQSGIFKVVQDCEKTLHPEVSDAFDREANAFASEVLFQLDGFMAMAEDHDFGVKVPLKLSKKFGASAYSSIRRYVSRNQRACGVLVLEPPVYSEAGFSADVRRFVPSERFAKRFGNPNFGLRISAEDRIGAFVPLGKCRMSDKRPLALTDRNGEERQCVAEAFATPYQVFILIHDTEKLVQKLHFISP